MLAPGQRLGWPGGRATVWVAGTRGDGALAALLLDADGRLVDRDAVRTTGHGRGVQLLGAHGDVVGLAVDPDALDPAVHRVEVVVSGPVSRAAVLRDDGTVVAEVEVAVGAGAAGGTGAAGDRAATTLVELYRRDGAWRLAAVLRAYAGGLAEATARLGRPGPATAAPAAAGTPQAAGPTPERALQLVGMVLDDASRTTASYRGSVAYAEERYAAETEALLDDLRLRFGPESDRARAAAEGRRAALVEAAAQAHRRDVDQLVAELRDLESTLPRDAARWDAPAWRAPGAPLPPPGAVAVARVGELGLAEAPDLRIPLLVGVPLRRPLLLAAPEGPAGGTAVRAAEVLATRTALARGGAGSVHVVRLGAAPGSSGVPAALLAGAPATTPPAATALLRQLADGAEVVRVAQEHRATDALDPALRRPRTLLVTGVEAGLDAEAYAALAHLARHGGAVGTSVVLTCAAAALDALGAGAGPEPADPAARALAAVTRPCLWLPVGDGDHRGVAGSSTGLVDGFGGVDWTFHPDLGPGTERLAALSAALLGV